MGIFSKLRNLFDGPKYRINRSILSELMKKDIKFSIEENLSFCSEFYLSPEDGVEEEHIIITNNDAPCDNPLEAEKDFTGITIYANRSSYYDPEKDEIYRDVDQFISSKLNSFPEWFIFRGDSTGLDQYKLK